MAAAVRTAHGGRLAETRRTLAARCLASLRCTTMAAINSTAGQKITKTGDEQNAVNIDHQERAYGGAAWANRLARRGYAVLVPDAFAFGSRRIRVADLPAAIRGGMDEHESERPGIHHLVQPLGRRSRVHPWRNLCSAQGRRGRASGWRKICMPWASCVGAMMWTPSGSASAGFPAGVCAPYIWLDWMTACAARSASV